jgi:hypothetical protein
MLYVFTPGLKAGPLYIASVGLPGLRSKTKTVSAVAGDPAGIDQLTVGAVSLPESVTPVARGGGLKTVRDGVFATAPVRAGFTAVRVHEPVNDVFNDRFRLNSSGFAAPGPPIKLTLYV